MNMKILIPTLLLVFFCLCKKHSTAVYKSERINFSYPVKVSIAGYSDDIMEPFTSRDGKYLFFNNLNNPAITNTNIYYAERINDTNFEYKGEVKGVNSA